MGPWFSNLHLLLPLTLYLQVAFENMQAIHEGEAGRNDVITAFSVQNPVCKMARYKSEPLKKALWKGSA